MMLYVTAVFARLKGSHYVIQLCNIPGGNARWTYVSEKEPWNG